MNQYRIHCTAARAATDWRFDGDCVRFCHGRKAPGYEPMRIFVGRVTSHSRGRKIFFTDPWPESLPAPNSNYSRGRCTGQHLDGSIGDFSKYGLFVVETWLLSRYRYLLDGKIPQAVAVSNVEPHSWLGYHIDPAPGAQRKQDAGLLEMAESAEETIELNFSYALSKRV